MEEQVKVDPTLDAISGPNIDELYLQHRAKKKKMYYIIGIAVAFLLALVIVIMACVPLDLRPGFITKPNDVVVYSEDIPSGSTSMDDASEHQEGYNTFIGIYNNMFRISLLSALFTGHLGGYVIDETVQEFDTSTSNLQAMMGSNFVKLHFDNEMKFKFSNGKDYVSKFDESYKLTFQNVYFPFSKDNKVNDVTFYFETFGNRSRATITKITLRANTYLIYDSLADFRAEEEAV